MRAEGRRQKSEVRGQGRKTEGGRRKAEGGRQKAEELFDLVGITGYIENNGDYLAIGNK